MPPGGTCSSTVSTSMFPNEPPTTSIDASVLFAIVSALNVKFPVLALPPPPTFSTTPARILGRYGICVQLAVLNDTKGVGVVVAHMSAASTRVLSAAANVPSLSTSTSSIRPASSSSTE